MELKTYFAQDRNGNLIPSATVHIFLTGTMTLATGLNTVGGQPLANPFTADADGKIQFRAPDGIYDMQVAVGADVGTRVTFQCVDIEQQLADSNSAADRAEQQADRAEQAAASASEASEQITGKGGFKSVGDIDHITTAVKVEDFGFDTGPGQDVNKLLAAFNQAEVLLFSKGTYYLPDFNMPNTAKCKKIIVRNSALRMVGYSAVFNVTDSFTIDLRDNGTWHGGLKRALTTKDHAIGVNKIEVDNASVFSVGDQVTTSFLIPDNYGPSAPWKWSNSLRNPGDELNYITEINGNVLTVKNPVEQRTLMKNIYIGNWQFSQDGLRFYGTGKVNILGGSMREFKTYGLVAADSIAVLIDGTEIGGMTIDCFYIHNNASLHMRNFRFWGSYDFGKQGIVHSSNGEIILEDGYWRRGNFDVEVYMVNHALITRHGKVTVRNVTAVGTSTLPLSGSQPDSVTGKTANELFGNRVNPARVFLSCATGADVNWNGVVLDNSSFIDYQRSTVSTEGETPFNIDISTLEMRDVVTTGSLFHLQVQESTGKTLRVRNYELRDLSVTRKYSINYYPLFYASSSLFFAFSGLLKYDDGGIAGQDHRVNTNNAYIPEMMISGGGEVILDSPTMIDTLVVRGSAVTKRPSGQRNDFTKLTTLASGTLSGDLKQYPSRLASLIATDFAFNANDSSTWVTLYTSPTTLTRVDVSIELVPKKTIAGATGISGRLSAGLNKDGTAVPVNMNASSYLSGAASNLAYWETKVVGMLGAIADGSVKLRCLSNGEVQININVPNYVSGTAFVTVN